MSTFQHRIVTRRESLGNSIVGQHALLDRLVIGLLCGGHVLVEGLPGLAKTTADCSPALPGPSPPRRCTRPC